MVQLGHVLSNEPRVTGFFGPWIIRHPRMGDPAWVDQSPTCVQAAHYTMYRPSWSTANLRLSLLSHWCFRWLFSPVAPWCQGAWVSGEGSALAFPYSQPRLAHSRPSNHSACRPLPAQDTLPSAVCRPPQFSHPRGLSTSTTCFKLSDVRTISGLSVVLMMCSGNFNWFPRPTFSCQSHADDNSPQFAVTEVSVQPWWMRCLAFLGAGIYSAGFQHRLHHLLPSAPGHCTICTSPLSGLLGSSLRCAPEILLQGTVDMLVFLPAPSNASLMDFVGHHTLDQELDILLVLTSKALARWYS